MMKSLKMNKDKIENLYILGNHIQALGLSRLGVNAELNITLFSDNNTSITRFSNTCNRFIKYKSLDDLLTKLLLNANQRNTIVVPTNDSIVGFLMNNYEVLINIY